MSKSPKTFAGIVTVFLMVRCLLTNDSITQELARDHLPPARGYSEQFHDEAGPGRGQDDGGPLPLPAAVYRQEGCDVS